MSEALDIVRAALRDETAWLVGGAVRDRLLGRDVYDLDVVIEGDARAAARHLALEIGGPAFELSDRFGAWRVIDSTRLLSVTANLGDVKTTIIHPASTTHFRMDDAALAYARRFDWAELLGSTLSDLGLAGSTRTERSDRSLG